MPAASPLCPREAGDRLGEAKMLMSMGESTAAKEGKAKAWGVSAASRRRSGVCMCRVMCHVCVEVAGGEVRADSVQRRL